MREGLFPVILGTAVTGTGLALRRMDMKKRGMSKHDTRVAVGAGLVGLGAAHIILGAIDMISDNRE